MNNSPWNAMSSRPQNLLIKAPVRLIKGDAAIKQKPVTLTLRLVATGELGVAYADKAEDSSAHCRYVEKAGRRRLLWRYDCV